LAQVEGKNPVLEFLRSGAEARWIRVAEGLERDPVIREVLGLAEDRGIPVEIVPRSELRRLSTTSREQGVIAMASAPGYASLGQILEKKTGSVFVLVLDMVQDPQNLGSILRTGEATGVDVVVIPRHGSVGITPVVHRVSMGGSTIVPVARENLFNSLKLLKDEGIKVIALDQSGSTDYFDVDLRGSLALVLGGEDKGVSQPLLERSDTIVRVPMIGKLQSLNVGVAAAVVMYERIRQLRQETRQKD
jgi:23S rRNA (guanosine2251-2'-O)-methyltransferase